MNDESLHKVGILAWSLTKLCVLLDTSPMWLSDEAAAALIRYGDLFSVLLLDLAAQALKEKRQRFKLRPKFHSLCCEIFDRIREGSRVNPRWVACFGEEDLVGKLARICKGSVHPSTLGRRVIERALLGLNMRLFEIRGLPTAERHQ